MKRMSTLSILCISLALWHGVVGTLITPTVQAQSTGTQGSWSTKAPLPIKLSEVGVAAANDKIYVLGGIAPGRVYQPVNLEYDPVTDRWRERAPLPRALNHAGAAGLNGRSMSLAPSPPRVMAARSMRLSNTIQRPTHGGRLLR